LGGGWGWLRWDCLVWVVCLGQGRVSSGLWGGASGLGALDWLGWDLGGSWSVGAGLWGLISWGGGAGESGCHWGVLGSGGVGWVWGLCARLCSAASGLGLGGMVVWALVSWPLWTGSTLLLVWLSGG
ncbi:hypothetical protein CesoFtcFv8_000231, partial [Champsocephalus esox]